jgi:glycosyltransferase involved in cell wall biosynthesis
MNVLMLSGDASVAQGRSGAFSDMLRYFARHWSRIDILTPTAPNAQARTLYDNVFIHPAPYHRALQPLFIRQRGAALLAERSYDLVVSHDFGFFYNGIGAYWLLRGRNIPLVSEIHHIEGYPLAVNLRERLWRAAARVYLPWAAQRVAAFRVVNAREVPAFMQTLGIPAHKIRVLSSLYLDLATFRPLPDVPKAYDVLFVARLASNKGIDLLLAAFRQVVAQFPQAKLGLRGEGGAQAQVERFIAQHGLQANIVFVPRVNDTAAMARLYNSAKMLVCASTVEGNPRVTIEAMACGVPVLSTAVGIMPEVIQNGANGFLFPRDPAALAAQIMALLRDPARAQQIGSVGQAAVQRFEAERVIAEYANGYKALLAQ